MATWAVGDVQGCLNSLEILLKKVDFDDRSDRLWLVGDLVGRGPDPCGVLDLVIAMGDRAVCVLGNHDLHLLAASFGLKQVKPKDRLSPILEHERRSEYINFYLKQPLIYYSTGLNCVMAHAGLYPWWSLSENLSHAKEVSRALAAPDPKSFLENMYGDSPGVWDDALCGWERLRFITNVFTRMRLCNERGQLDLKHKGGLSDAPDGFSPWFNFTNPGLSDTRVVFGHWSTLGIVNKPPYLGLDSGCVWGRCLSAVHLESEHVNIISVPCDQNAKIDG